MQSIDYALSTSRSVQASSRTQAQETGPDSIRADGPERTVLVPCPIRPQDRIPLAESVDRRTDGAPSYRPLRRGMPSPLSLPLSLDSQDRDHLFAEFQPLVQRLIRQYGDEPELREELVGEIYCRFCSLLDAYDPGRGIPLRPYLVHQLAFSVYSFVRCQWRRHRREISLELEAVAGGLPKTENVSGAWDDAMMMHQVQAGLPLALAELSSRQRQVVIWRYYESRSFEEIAERLNVQLATARSTLRHALKNMRRKLLEENLTYE